MNYKSFQEENLLQSFFFLKFPDNLVSLHYPIKRTETLSIFKMNIFYDKYLSELCLGHLENLEQTVKDTEDKLTIIFET